MKKWIVSESKKSLNYVGNPLVESINGYVTKTKDGYNAFISEQFIGTYADSAKAKNAVELNVGDKLYEAGLRDMIASGFDRIAVAAGSKSAEGRIQLRTGTNKLMGDWKIYGAREKGAGNLSPSSKSPTLADLVDFFASEYGMELSAEQLQTMAGAGATKPSEEKKPDGEPEKPVKESTIMEADSPETMTFDPKVVFPRLANGLIKLGILKVSDKDGNYKGDYDKKKVEKALDTQSFDGYTVNMINYSKFLQKNGIANAEEMHKLMSKLNASVDPKSAEAQLSFVIVAGFSANIINADKIDKAKNITASKHTIDMHKLVELLKKYSIPLKYLVDIGSKIKNEDNKVEALKTIIGAEEASIVRSMHIAKCILNSIVTVEEEKDKSKESSELIK